MRLSMAKTQIKFANFDCQFFHYEQRIFKEACLREFVHFARRTVEHCGQARTRAHHLVGGGLIVVEICAFLLVSTFNSPEKSCL